MQCLGASKIPQAMWVFPVFPRGGKTFLAILGECHNKNFAFKIKCSFAHLKGVWQPQDSPKRLLHSPAHNTHVGLRAQLPGQESHPGEQGGLYSLKLLKTPNSKFQIKIHFTG